MSGEGDADNENDDCKQLIPSAPDQMSSWSSFYDISRSSEVQKPFGRSRIVLGAIHAETMMSYQLKLERTRARTRL